jgi:heat shock protein 5
MCFANPAGSLIYIYFSLVYGAALQAGFLSGAKRTRDLVLLDVNPLSITYEILGGTTRTIIPCYTLIPYEKYNIFTTTYSNQRIITFKVLESESSITRNNHILGKFDLTGIQCAEQGVPTIGITSFINVNDICYRRRLSHLSLFFLSFSLDM